MEEVEVCNSWEEFEDNTKLLDQQLEKLKIHKVQETRSSPPESESESQSSSTSSSGGLEAPSKMRVLKRNMPMPLPASNVEARPMESPVASTNGMLNGGVVIQEESPRTQYVPPEPRISVLSRPKKKSADDMSGKSKNQPVKTLEQREQEYAEARRRIFGDTQVES